MKLRMKLATILSAVAMLGLSTVTASAVSIGFGFSGGGTYGEVSGTETLNDGNNGGAAGATQSATQGAHGALGTIYGQVIVGESIFGDGNGFAIGYEHFAGTAKIESNTGDERSDLANGATTTTTVNGTNQVEAHLEDLNTIFIETPGFTPLGIYLKAGLSSMEVITNENLYTVSVYGNGSVDGETYGFGFKKAAGGFQVKTEFNYTEWDTLTLSNTGLKAGAKNVSADPENWAFKFGVGYNF